MMLRLQEATGAPFPPRTEKHRAPSKNTHEGPESKAFIHWLSSNWFKTVPWEITPLNSQMGIVLCWIKPQAESQLFKVRHLLVASKSERSQNWPSWPQQNQKWPRVEAQAFATAPKANYKLNDFNLGTSFPFSY